MEKSYPFVHQYWIGILVSIVGLGITGDVADGIIVTKIIGIISAFLVVTSFVLNDKEGKGIFPAYDETTLIAICKQDPLATALVVVVKNLFLVALIVLAVMFLRP